MKQKKSLPLEGANFRRSSEEIAILVKSRSDFLDSLIRMGEEPYEIEIEVASVAELIAVGISKKIQGLPYQLIYASSKGLLQYIYLYRWCSRSSLARLPGTWLADFLNVLTDNGKDPWPSAPLSLSQFYSIFFHYLQECGVAVNLKVLLRVLEKFEKGFVAQAAQAELTSTAPSGRTVH